ncbi:hypothetical protein SCUP515_00914 [Seiridium cupressi]
MASESQFHPFPRLPPEVQLMIWEEARPNYVHHFHLGIKETRIGGPFKWFYLRKDVTTGFQASRLTHINGPEHAPPLDPADTRPAQKVNLDIGIFTVHDSVDRNLHNIDVNRDDQPTLHPAGTSVYLNFDRDVFAFGPDIWPRGRFPHSFGFLHMMMSLEDREPPHLQDSHWVFKVQKLALIMPSLRKHQLPYEEVCAKSLYVPFSAYDRSLIKRMATLKQIYVVIAHSWNCRRGLNKQLKVNWNYDGFAPYKEFVEAHYPEPARSFERCECALHETAGHAFVENMKAVLANFEKKPNVEVVVERRILWS